jgi:hypothetical protein
LTCCYSISAAALTMKPHQLHQLCCCHVPVWRPAGDCSRQLILVPAAGMEKKDGVLMRCIEVYCVILFLLVSSTVSAAGDEFCHIASYMQATLHRPNSAKPHTAVL